MRTMMIDLYLFLIVSSFSLIGNIQAIPHEDNIQDFADWNTIGDVVEIGGAVTDSDVLTISTFLLRLLEMFQSRPLPMIYVEDIVTATPFVRPKNFKRQYLGNRPPTKHRYICQPTREDIFKLLVALQDMRRDGPDKSINFCNLQRSTGAIFTNIRLLRSREISTPTPPR